MRSSRRIALAAAAFAAGIALATLASATPGPGGWDNLGQRPSRAEGALNSTVNALNADVPGVLYVGGAFTDAAEDPAADYLAQWSGGAWKPVAPVPLNGAVYALAARGGNVYVGGVFTNAGGNANADSLAVWNGRSWGTVCDGPALGGNVFALEIVGSTIYVGGTFQNGAGIASADYVLACDLNTGAARSTVANDGDFDGGVFALAADARGRLYAGGSFIIRGVTPAADNVAYLDGTGWHGLGTARTPGQRVVDSRVRSLAVSGTDVYVGTDAVNVAGIPQADHVARWNGTAWSALGANAAGTDGAFPPSTSINALATSGARVFAGGQFLNAAGDPRADYLAEFDGKVWKAIGSDGGAGGAMTGVVHALTTFGAQLVAGGGFTNTGGNGLADFVATYPLAGTPGGGGGGGTGGGGTTTTTTGGGAAAPPTGTPTGTVLVNGRPFTGGRIPYRSVVDVTNGRLTLRTDVGTLKVRGANRIPAVFVLLRGVDRKKPIVELRLTRGNFSVCPKRKTSSAGRATATIVRQVWGDGKGKFRTKGRYSSATVRGTNWLTADRCDGTLTRVVRGVIQVNDLPQRRLVTVRAGRTYLARP